ncbi:FAD-dependent oxidoreductase [Streptomyces mirabilis]|uniref:FAD-dependent oxidoreductase n=1 Tax=Streptomyces mirabilis TaxID=68239 RepID=UPI0036E56D41
MDTLVEIPALADAEELSCDVLVIGGGTAGTMAALTAAEHGADVLLLEKAHVRHSGALARSSPAAPNPTTTSPRSPAPMTASSTSPPSARPRPAASRWCGVWSRTA